MGVLIDNSQSSFKISLPKLKKTAQAILDGLESPDAELSILLVDDPQIEELNQIYLNRSGPTNVIAFPMREGPFGNLNPNLLGDVVISVDTALREADAGEVSAERRMIELLVHGILHLLGYDHEHGGPDALRMEEKSVEILNRIAQP
jgi:rRNA maturation RNase YbeY